MPSEVNLLEQLLLWIRKNQAKFTIQPSAMFECATELKMEIDYAGEKITAVRLVPDSRIYSSEGKILTYCVGVAMEEIDQILEEKVCKQ